MCADRVSERGKAVLIIRLTLNVESPSVLRHTNLSGKFMVEVDPAITTFQFLHVKLCNILKAWKCHAEEVYFVHLSWAF